MRRLIGPDGPTRLGLALLGLACLAGFGLVLLVAIRTGVGQRIDARLFSLVLDTIPGDLRRALDGFARRLLILVLSPVTALLVLVAIVRGRRRAAFFAVMLPVLLVPVSLWLRDAAVHRPDLGVPGYTYNTFPSVHATAVFALLAGVVAVWPAVLRPSHGALIVATAVVAGVGNVAWYAHRPADVLGSLLLVAGPTLCAWAVLQPRYRATRSSAGALARISR